MSWKRLPWILLVLLIAVGSYGFLRERLWAGLEALGSEQIARVLAAVAAFDNFREDNDPYGEHDCAIVSVDNLQVLFKIDYFDRDLSFHSPDPSDPAVTERVMTVMLAEEY